MVLVKDSLTGFSGQKGFGGADSSVANLSNIQKNFINQVDAKREAGMGVSSFEEKKYNKFKEKQKQNISSATTTDTSGVTRPTAKTFLKNQSVNVANLSDAQEKRELRSILNSDIPLSPKQRIDLQNKIQGVVPLKKADASEEIRTGNQFSPVVSDMDTSPSLGATEGSLLASASIGEDAGFNEYIDKNYTREVYDGLPGYMKRDAKDQYNDSIKFRDGTQINQAPAKEKTLTERVADFTGKVVNTVTGTQPAIAQTKGSREGMFGGSVPEGTYSQFSPTSKPQYQVNREKNRPNQNTNTAEAGAGVKFGSVNLNAAKGVETTKTPKTPKTPSEDTSFSSYVRSGGIGQQRGDTGSGDTSFSSYVRGAGEGQERGNTRLAEARKIAKRNPNVSINKSTGKAEATNDSGKARAQASAVNRKLSGRSISQTKADNKASMRASAKERQANFKKTGKSTVSARRAKAKASMRARAKARHNASQARKKAKARSKARNAARSRAKARRRSRGRRGRRCDIFLKYNISPLTNMNLIRDDLAEVAYFVKEIQK